MSLRDLTLAGALLLAGGLVVVGVSRINDAAGLITGGVLLALWSWLVLADDGSAAL